MTLLEEQQEFAKAIANENLDDYHGEQAHTFTNPALHECISQVIQNTRIDWLRSEIEKLESDERVKSKIGFEKQGTKMQQIKQRVFAQGYNKAKDEFITRYKEELLELEKVNETT